jgi:hypothetical protein
VSSALILLVSLLAVLPVFLALDGSIARLILSLWIAAVIAAVGVAMRPSEAQHGWRTVRILAPLALLPAIWMAIQVLPTPFLPHPVWQSAAAALDEPLRGRISADPALSLAAIFRYLSALGVIIAAMCIAIDRRRARLLLRILVAVTSVVTIAFVIVALGGFGVYDAVPRASFDAICSLGVLLAASLVVNVVDQYQARRRGVGLNGRILAEFSAGCVALAICLVTAAIFVPNFVLIAGLCGLVPIMLVTFLHHVAMRRWDACIVVGLGIIAAAVLVTNQLQKSSGNMAVRIAASASKEQIAIVERMMSDAGPLGTGAGTYRVLVPIYRGIDDPPVVFMPPTSAAAIAVEWGRSAVVAIPVIAGLLVIVLFRRALGRGRDSVYAAAGSGCVLLTALEMFCDASLLATAVWVLVAVTLGLALGQSVSLPRN